MKTSRRFTFSIALVGLLSASHATAQTITTRTSRLNFGYVYGGGGDSNTDSELVEDFALLPADTETTGYTGSTSGTLPNGQEYTAGVECDIDQTFEIVGPLTGFESISASASVDVGSSVTGAGVAAMQATNPGNELKFEFTVTTSVHYHLTGHFQHPNPGVFHGVLLQWFNGFGWQAVFSTFFTPNGPFDQSGTLIPGQYRMYSFIGLNVQGSQSASTTYDYLLTIRRSADMNCDGLVDGRDVGAFVTALLDAPAYAAQFPACDRNNADVNFDDAVTAADVAQFTQCVTAGGCP